ncbi:MAG: hypothetical protein JW850_20705 [Thermoflexales bacterium]|nr:hypothetical protein [Thermoflexales bacterium]
MHTLQGFFSNRLQAARNHAAQLTSWRPVYRALALLTLLFGLWGIGRVAWTVNQPMGGFLWYYDEAVSGGWIVNLDTGLDWPGIQAGLRPGDRILSIDGRPAAEFGQIYHARPPGDSITYRVRRDGREIDIPDIPIVRFSWGMFVYSQAIMFAVGLIFWLLSVFVHSATPESEASYTFSFFTLFDALPFFFHAFSVSVNAPHYPQAISFFTWKPAFALAAATGIHFATIFPSRTLPLPWRFSRSGIRYTSYIAAVLLIAGYVLTSLLGMRQWEATAYTLNLGSLFVGLLVCAMLFTWVLVRDNSFIARRQARAMLVGWAINALQLIPLLVKLIWPHASTPSWNLVTFLGSALPLSMVYAILRYRLFSVRLFLLRLLRYIAPAFGGVFVYLAFLGISINIVWFDQALAALTRLTYQHIDLRATLATSLAAFATFWLYTSVSLWSSRQLYGLESRLSSILVHLCDQLDVHNGYIALRQGDAFQFRSVHNMALPNHLLDQQTVLDPEEGIALKVPLGIATQTTKTLLGIVALGPRLDGSVYTAQEQTFLHETVAELLASSLHHIQQLEQFSDAVRVSFQMATQIQQQERDLQRQLAQAFLAGPEMITYAEVDKALCVLRDAPRGDKSDLGESKLADLPTIRARLKAQGLEQPTLHQKGLALQAHLRQVIDSIELQLPQSLTGEERQIIESLKHALPQSDTDKQQVVKAFSKLPPSLFDKWKQYLILKHGFVPDAKWTTLHGDLDLSQADYYRKRKAAIRMLTVQLQEHERALGKADNDLIIGQSPNVV